MANGITQVNQRIACNEFTALCPCTVLPAATGSTAIQYIELIIRTRLELFVKVGDWSCFQELEDLNDDFNVSILGEENRTDLDNRLV
ncbi:hypothetical protein scyTo_0006679 [Scyliorhinus torazame]|uniref:Uncharacterized protein n=1 Tax=Scyliorhinus torazame TaxID=75743 RepID=A0A401PJB7_SCYTO|nr:hypothetical protein [Scyliorhinus torazame]